MSLGDIIDGKNSRSKESESALRKVLDVMHSGRTPCEDIHHVVGNHELYNFSRETLNDTLTRKGTYYSFTQAGLRVLIIDSFEISTCGKYKHTWQHQQAQETLLANNCNIREGKHDYSAGMVGPEKRFQPYNGDMSEAQFEWMEETLGRSRQEGERVVISSHMPICPAAAGYGVLMWSYERMLALLEEYKDTVVLFLAGHDHSGGSAFDPAGIYHLTLPSPLNCDMTHIKDNYAIVRIHRDTLTIQGYGQVKSITIPLLT